MNKVGWVAVLMVLALSSAAAQAPRKGENWAIERIDNYLGRSITQGFSGAVMVANGNHIVLKKGYGNAVRNSDIPITTATLFDIGSVTKQFTAAAIIMLQDQQKLSVNDTLARFFPKVPHDKQSITVHQLLTHTSGLPAGLGVGDFEHIGTTAFFNRLMATPLRAAPGEQFHYSNVGYSLLARIIELVADDDYERVLQTLLFRPAGMMHTGYLAFDASSSVTAAGYKSGVVMTPTTLSRYKADGQVSWALKGNGGIISSIDDMYNWYLALRNHVVLSEAQVELLTTRHVVENAERNQSYGYGWSIFSSPRGNKMIGHNGSNGVYYFDFRWLPDDDLAILYASNALMKDTPAVSENIELMLFDDVFNPPAFAPGPVTQVLAFAMAYKGPAPTLAKTIAEKFSQQISERYVLNRAGLTLLDAGKTERAISVLKLNVERFAEDGNLWDSLGEAQLAAGHLEAAKQSFVKALVKAPQTQCYWCANAQDKLQHIKMRQKAAIPVTSAGAG
ncbi:serine hydrolase domain-containing protein [Salinimonas sediminis]|uniref:Beta-lactamase-related domain-containing protein n=1 Tax=Salinimonas sediminis TaxID=2303538 RepID=A0A346NHL9_9ALTE|nr:serine hydrolase domain-containing protein [Salinimonas sediminis]AXR05026.1 hypothetical protein D0Y50_00765 [Salinimonas sediminis]